MKTIQEFHDEVQELVNKYSGKDKKLSYTFRSNSSDGKIDRFLLEVLRS